MIRPSGKYTDALLLAGLVAATVVCVFAFLQADRYSRRTHTALQESYEVQWRAAQLRERVIEITAQLQTWQVTGEAPPRIIRNTRFLAHNIRTTVELPYIEKYINAIEIDRLRRTLSVIEEDVLPLLDDYANVPIALQYVASVRDDLLRVSAATVTRLNLVNDTTHNQEKFQLFTFFSAIALSGIIFAAGVIAWRYRFTRWKNVHMRSFASLFAHMTRTRVAALRLFLERLTDHPGTSPEMVEQARRTVNELVSINDRLVSIAFSGSDARGKSVGARKKLGDLLEEIVAHHAPHVLLDADHAARKVMVPSSEFLVVIDELVGNARKAVACRKDPEIKIAARVRRGFLGRRRLFLKIEDNGIGMAPEVLAQASDLFFSTRAGTHVGLGLGSCVAIVEAMAGQLTIESASGVGTTVLVTYPL